MTDKRWISARKDRQNAFKVKVNHSNMYLKPVILAQILKEPLKT